MRLFRAAIVLVTGAAVALVIGFLSFVDDIVETAPPADARAEGIVVLTGGSARIEAALRLLAEGRASRLLISGVNPSVGSTALAGVVDDDADAMLACCVDLGHEALDTSGNASETRIWAENQQFGSLIVVTSAYHMPRSLAELGAVMPDVELVAYPVLNPELRLDDWWRDPAAFEVLAREYGKFLLVMARTAFGAPATAASGT
jgi:uncharacterized SAM-binding protein YcdF (DUF218 family)